MLFETSSKHELFVSTEYLVSPLALKYYEWAHLSSLTHQGVFGYSLFMPNHSGVTGKPFSTLEHVFYYQNADVPVFVVPQSEWNAFVQWYRKNSALFPFVPESFANIDAPAKPWRLFLQRYLYQTNQTLLYAQFGQDRALTKAMNDTPTKLVDEPTLRHWQSSLPTAPVIFNLYAEPVASVEQLFKSPVDAFDQCTLLLSVYSRYKNVMDRLDHLQHMPSLRSIIVVWNYQEADPPILASDRFVVPVFFRKQAFNSLNNRYQPFSQVTTDCVISMDDDWDMPVHHLEFSVMLWRTQFWNQIVGFRHLGRYHTKEKNEWVYHAGKYRSASMMLPSGSVYHRKYLGMYANALPSSAKGYVDSVLNCEDILFNFMVSNATRTSPVVVKVKREGSLKMEGLSDDPQHYIERSECLQVFSNIFGYMPLRYTHSMFNYGDKLPHWNEFDVRDTLGPVSKV